MLESVFVYGTLRSGERNHRFAVSAGLVDIAAARAEGLALYHLEPEGYPAVVAGAGVVVGELLTLAGGLARLDRLEGVDRPEPRYARVRWTVTSGAERHEAWIYLFLARERLDGSGAKLLEHGDWIAR